jgi:hypothetical protein
MGAHQPRGIRAGRKLKTHRREQRWKSIKYSKANTVATMKARPLGSASMVKGSCSRRCAYAAAHHRRRRRHHHHRRAATSH